MTCILSYTNKTEPKIDLRDLARIPNLIKQSAITLSEVFIGSNSA